MTTERRGIPGAQFVEDVQTYLSQSSLDVNSALSFFQERHQQYKLAELKLLAQPRELQKCLDVEATLQAKKDTGEATTLLQKNLENAKASLEVLLGDLQFLRDQVTISQVHDSLKSLTGYNCPHLQLGCPPAQDSSSFWYPFSREV